MSVQALAAALKKTNLWGRNSFRKNLDAHKEMTDIWVRYNTIEACGGDWSIFNDEHEGQWYPAYCELPEVRPLIFNLMRHVEGERLGGVLITKIPPGCGIAPHVDRGWHVEYYDKYYISIEAAQGARFYHCSGEYIEPKQGDIWLFDNRLEHWVENKSNQDRVTLIVCIRSHRAR